MKKIRISLLALISIAITGCATSHSPAASLKTEDTIGAYVVPAGTPHYAVVNHQLCAESGGVWYQLRAPEYDFGDVRGAHLVKKEKWIQVGGSHVRTYYRMPASFRNAAVAPEFVQE